MVVGNTKIYENKKYMKTINRIFLFGDSWIEGQGTYEYIENDGVMYEPSIPFEKLGEWRKKNSWNKLIKKYTTSDVINFGRQGSDNYSQFSELNNQITNFTSNDLILFGFTSKLRDRNSFRYNFDDDYKSNLIHQKNPLRGVTSWDKTDRERYNFGFHEDNAQMQFKDINEKKFTENFIQDYFLSVYDEYPFEYIAQVNYLFYQQFCKTKKINIVFFDLFEQYINPKYVKETYNVDKDIYINYSGKTMNEFLIEYEIKNIKDNEPSLWESGKRRPDLESAIWHPNQHGYEVYVDYLFTQVLPKKYKFVK